MHRRGCCTFFSIINIVIIVTIFPFFPLTVLLREIALRRIQIRIAAVRMRNVSCVCITGTYYVNASHRPERVHLCDIRNNWWLLWTLNTCPDDGTVCFWRTTNIYIIVTMVPCLSTSHSVSSRHAFHRHCAIAELQCVYFAMTEVNAVEMANYLCRVTKGNMSSAQKSSEIEIVKRENCTISVLFINRMCVRTI